MSLFQGPMRRHLDGHKDLTEKGELRKTETPQLVYIPLVNCGQPATPCVQEGDKVKVGTKVAERNDRFIVPLFSSVSGTVKGIQKMMSSSLTQVDHLVVENDGQYETIRAFEPINWETASNEDLCTFMTNAGIIGCGGAGFPTYVKYKGCKDVKVLIINGVECEPYITADDRMMKNYLSDLVTGVRAMLKMSGAPVAKVAIKETHKETLELVTKAFSEYKNIEVVSVPDVYPMGWERTLVYEITKQRYDRLPGEVGCIVNNATTAIAFAQALTQGKPIVEKIVTVSGDGIKEPANVQVPVGVPAQYLIQACGGYTANNVMLIAGGPMMGKTITTDAFVITPSTNALTVFKNVDLEPLKCLRCGKCSDYCPAGLQPVRISQANKSGNIEMLEKLNVLECIECGSCTFTCPSRIDVTENMRRAKKIIMARMKK